MMTKMNRLVVPFLALGAFWAFSGCSHRAVREDLGGEARIDCEVFCDAAEMVLVEIRHIASAQRYECICSEVDPE